MADLKWKITEITGICKDDVEKITYNNAGTEEVINVGAEYSNSISSIKVYIKKATDCKKGIEIKFSASTGDKKSLYVSRSCDEPEPGDCEIPDEDTDLNDYLSVFNVSVGRNITPKDTPCTYTYLKEGFNYVKSQSSTAIAWFLANMLSELTPNPTKVTNYFKDATKGTNTKDWGKVPELTSTTDTTIDYETKVYNDRINSAYLFAKFRHNTYTTDKDLVESSRDELGGTLNETTFSQLKVYRDSPGTYYDQYGNYVPTAYGNYIPNAPSQTGTTGGDEPNNTYDGKLMYSLNDCQGDGYCSIGDLSTKYTYHFLPVYDKRHGTCYARTIYNISKEGVSDSTIENFINQCEEVEYLTSNFAKGGDFAQRYRWRPGSCTVGGRHIYYICDDDTESSYAQTVCGSESRSTCENQRSEYVNGNTSYPSGHASWGYTVALLATLISGEYNCDVNDPQSTTSMSVKDRGILYGQHRYIVKAHWPSDVLIGQIIASSCIGYLMGFEQFITLYENIINGDTPTTDNFFCSINGYYNCNPTCGYNDCDRERCKQEQNPGLIIWQKLNAEWENVTFEITNTNVVGNISDELKESIKNNIGIGGAGIKNGTLYKTGTRVSPDNVNYNVCESFLHYPLVNSNEHVSMTASIKFTGSRGGNVITMEYTANNTCE